MDAATKNQNAKAKLAAALAGLEGGMVGVLWMLAWLGLSAVWQQRSFWTPENLMSTAFDRNASLGGFGWPTFAGLALYVVMYSLLGALFGILVHHRVPRKRIMLVGVVFSLAWYYFSFRWTFRFALPLVSLLHVERSTMLGHLVFGMMLGRLPIYVHRLMGSVENAPAPVVAIGTQDEVPTEPQASD